MGLCDLWPGAAPSDELERALADFVRRAGAWPELPPEPKRLIPWTAQRLGSPDAVLLAEAPAADLHLACACAAGDARALSQFEELLHALKPALVSVGVSGGQLDEVVQRLRVQLLVGPQPGIGGYAGRGSLRAWLRVVAVREGVRALRELGRGDPFDDRRLLDTILPDVDVEHDLTTADFRIHFRAAFEEAVAALAARARLILRQHAVDDLTIDQIGALHRVHRATAARWIEQARADLSSATERALQRRLGVSLDEVRGMLRLYMSRLDASVYRLLCSPSS
jgi:RNA polymerase sigma-70 factor (ECF subfamily)